MKEEELCRAPCKPGQETLEETIKIQGKGSNVHMEAIGFFSDKWKNECFVLTEHNVLWIKMYSAGCYK